MTFPVFKYLPPAPPAWIEGMASGVWFGNFPGENAHIYCPAYLQTQDNPPEPVTIAPGQWTTVDLTGGTCLVNGVSCLGVVPPYVVAIDVSAVLIHTPGQVYEAPLGIEVMFGKTGRVIQDPTFPDAPEWVWQCDSYSGVQGQIQAGGSRTNGFMRLPLVNGQFDFKWVISTPPLGVYPTYSDYAVHPVIVGYEK